MRKRIPYRVCSCTPKKGIVQIESRILVTMVNREIRRIKCWKDTRRQAWRGKNIGNICFKSWHPIWAIKVFRWTCEWVEFRDWQEYRYEDWTDSWYGFFDVTSEMEARELGCCADEVYEWLGHPELAHNELDAKLYYQSFFIDKYKTDDHVFDEEEDEPDTSIQIFNDGLPYWKPLFTQYIYTLYDHLLYPRSSLPRQHKLQNNIEQDTCVRK